MNPSREQVSRLKTALKTTSSELQKIRAPYRNQALSLTYHLRKHNELGTDNRIAVLELLTDNMSTKLQASSMGWSLPKKKRELFHPRSRFIIVKDFQSNLVGFAMFRFEKEDQFVVLYCYELQVSEGMRGLGVGRCVMSMLEAIGSKYGMDKIMLTALKANDGAIRFYQGAGFGVDASDPTNFGVATRDYQILSKRLPRPPSMVRAASEYEVS